MPGSSARHGRRVPRQTKAAGSGAQAIGAITSRFLRSSSSSFFESASNCGDNAPVVHAR